MASLPSALAGATPAVRPVSVARLPLARTRVSFIVPAYNEAATIVEVLHRIERLPLETQVIVVDDGSTDETPTLLSRWQESRERAHVITQPNRGKGAAIRAAIPHVDGDIIVIQDADMEYDPADVPRLVAPITEGAADVVFGSRLSGGQPQRVHMFWHLVGNRMLSLLTNVLFNTTLTDMETGYKVFRAEVLRSLTLRQDDFAIEPEIAAQICKRRLRIYEVPISYYGRTYDEGKKITWRDGVTASEGARHRAAPAVSEAAALVFHPKQAETLRRMEEADNYNRWLVERGTHLIGRRVLDAGAGIGTFSEQIADGRQVVALEPDPAFLPGLRRRFLGRPNVVVVASAIEEFEREPPPDLFDTILCFNVLEHIVDDEGTLQRFCRLLKPGGTLLLLVPAHPVAYGKVDSVLGHERRYGKPALAAKLAQAGLEVTKLRHVNPLGLLGWLVTSRVLRASQLPSGALRLFDRHVPILRLLDCLHFPFGLSLWAVARRPV